MYRRTLFFCSSFCILALALLLSACGPFGSNLSPTLASSRVANAATRVVSATTSIDQLVQDVLENMHEHAWNPQAMTHGVVTGGLYINWKMDDPSVTNDVRPGPDGNPRHNHDPQVDLFYLTALAEYQQLHPADHSFDSDLNHMTEVVLADFGSYSLPKGWIYFYLLHDGLLLQNPNLLHEAHTVANNFYQGWYSPTLGLVYEKNHHPADYAVDLSLMAGAALIDAGQRWNEPQWVKAGESDIDHILSVAIDPKYGLFYNSMKLTSEGQNVPENYQAKPSTQGQAVDALITAYTLTHNTHYLDVAGNVLQSLYGSALWDAARGGFYFAIDMNNGRLLGDYKETRSQTLTLLALHHFNQFRPQFTQQEQQMIAVITNHFYESTYHGFFYRVTPDFQIYASRAGVTGIGVEDYFTTEAMGGALDALQTAEMP